MPFKAHKEFIPPVRADARIWRYTDLPKFLSLLDRSALFFCRLDKLGDPYEGYYTRAILMMDDLRFEDLSDDLRDQLGIPDEKTFNSLLGSRRQFREMSKLQREIAFVNSWYCQEYESAAMWAQYLKTEDGIAVQSSYERLVKSLAEYTEYNVQIGLVRYIDYERDMITSGNLFAPLMCKRKSFEHERELRALIWTVESNKNGFGVDNKLKNCPGFYVSVDLEALVERIYVAPTAPNWLRPLIESITRKFGLKVPVEQSRLADAAIY